MTDMRAEGEGVRTDELRDAYALIGEISEAVGMFPVIDPATNTREELLRRVRALARPEGVAFAAFVSFNGERLRWTDRRITYAQAVRTCHPGSNLDTIYTVVFSTHGGRDGTLRPGQDTEVEEGMVINATITGAA